MFQPGLSGSVCCSQLLEVLWGLCWALPPISSPSSTYNHYLELGVSHFVDSLSIINCVVLHVFELCTVERCCMNSHVVCVFPLQHGRRWGYGGCGPAKSVGLGWGGSWGHPLISRQSHTGRAPRAGGPGGIEVAPAAESRAELAGDGSWEGKGSKTPGVWPVVWP